MEMSEQNEEAGDEKKQPVPAGVVRAALIRRAVEDIRRIIQIRTAKQALTTLLARGSIGDDLWQRFLRAEKEMEEELRDVVLEVRNDIRAWRSSANMVTGKRHSTRLGPSHLPNCQRDRRKYGAENEA